MQLVRVCSINGIIYQYHTIVSCTFVKDTPSTQTEELKAMMEQMREMILSQQTKTRVKKKDEVDEKKDEVFFFVFL